MKSYHAFIIAGPNGAGKTTFAKEFLPSYAKCRNFVNADMIAQGLSPFSPRIAAIKAGRIMLDQINEYGRKKENFAFETTLSGRLYVEIIKTLKESGYKIHLIYLWIPKVELALARVKNRVAEGGHDVPAADIRRRFGRSLKNFFEIYMSLADLWMVFDNSGVKPELIAEGQSGVLRVLKQERFVQVKRLSRGERDA